MKKTTVVFDLDGTLLDTLQDLANAVNYALEHQGMPKRTLEEVRQFVGNGVRLLMIRAVPDGESNPLFEETFATVYKGNIIKNLIMDCQSYTKYRPNETTGGIFVSWRRKEELPTGA